jgi:hypothetical protein
MMGRLLTALFALSFTLGLGSVASAKQCRDAKGKFMKCKTAMTMSHKPCRDKKGKFMKCPPMKM